MATNRSLVYVFLVGAVFWFYYTFSAYQSFQHDPVAPRVQPPKPAAAVEHAYTLPFAKGDHDNGDTTPPPPLRILHIVTTLSEYNNGARNTIQGQDRLAEVLLPVLKSTVESFLEVPHWTVDVYLILGFAGLAPERRQIIVDGLPDGVGLEIWEDAVPIGYPRTSDQKTQAAPHALARQHRFVIKDKLDHYDFFSAWEDDMSIQSHHVINFLQMSNQINALKARAVESPNTHQLYGTLSKAQLDRLIPGFVRVEVLRKNVRTKSISTVTPVTPLPKIDPYKCCSLSLHKGETEKLVPGDLGLWETEIKAFGVRHIPDSPLGWVAFQPAVTLSKTARLDSYWSGVDGAFGAGVKRPGRDGNLMGQQAGLMATREQILHFDNICPGGYLPPYDSSFWGGQSGLKPQNVEFWSGGYHLFGRCGLQRIISLDPDNFSRQLLFHSANNKQRQITKSRFVRAEDLLGQLHTVVINALHRLGGPDKYAIASHGK